MKHQNTPSGLPMDTYTDNPSFHISPKYMSENALSEMLSARPVLNADVIFHYQGKVYLPVRISKPANGLWVIGGAMKAGEQPADTLVRRVKAETSLDIDAQRFKFIKMINFIWSYRKEDPQEDGRHDYNIVHSLEVTPEELAIATQNLDPSEYDAKQGLISFDSVTALKQFGARQNIIDCCKSIFNQA